MNSSYFITTILALIMILLVTFFSRIMAYFIATKLKSNIMKTSIEKVLPTHLPTAYPTGRPNSIHWQFVDRHLVSQMCQKPHKCAKNPNMNAILIIKRTKYDCNYSSESDYIWLQCLSKKTWYENHESEFFSHSHVILRRNIAIIFGPFWKTLQSYIVRFRSEIALILGDFLIKIAIILSPHNNCHCNHIWSPS